MYRLAAAAGLTLDQRTILPCVSGVGEKSLRQPLQVNYRVDSESGIEVPIY